MPGTLQERLKAAEETLRALRSGEVDAIMVAGPDGDQVYMLKGADKAYRLIIQNMAEGALTISPAGLILFCNEELARILGRPHEYLIGSSLPEYIFPEDAQLFWALLRGNAKSGAKGEVRLKSIRGELMPASLSVSRLDLDGVKCFCIILSDLTERKRNEEVLHALSARLLQFQDNDRRHIGHRLHDAAFQRLAAVEFSLTTLGKTSTKLSAGSRRILSESLTQIGECCRELADLAYLIQPPLLEEQGLEPALRAFVADHNRIFRAQISVRFPCRLGRLSAGVETTLFRVAEEAISNIDRHAGACKAEIRFWRERSRLRFEIADHGRGIPSQILTRLNKGTALPGVGIAGIRERIRSLGGFLQIDSDPIGTTVRVNLPATPPPTLSKVEKRSGSSRTGDPLRKKRTALTSKKSD
jgi:PAS domain S-box-containing protein